MAYQARAGDIISLQNEKAGSLVLSTGLADFGATSTDPVTMFAYRDAFRTVAEAIATSMANVPLNLYQRDDKNGRRKLYGEDDPVAAALESPSDGVTPFRWVESLQLDHILHDRWACLILRNDDRSIDLVRLPARWISFNVDAFRRVTHVALYRPGREVDRDPLLIPISEVLFDVGYDPAPSGKTTKGFSVSRTLEASAAELERGAAYRQKLLQHGPKIPMFISRPSSAPDWIRNGGRDRFVETFREYSAGRSGEVPILEDGMELKDAPQLDAGDVAYIETRKAAQIEFAISMHYPPELIGYRPGNFANIAALREHLYVDVLGGRISAFRQALNLGFRRAGLLLSGRYVEENVAVRLMGNPELQASILQTQTGAPIRTRNESRRLLNLPPIEGGDDLIVPLNVTKGGLASPTDTGPKAALPAGRRALKAAAPAPTKAELDALDKRRDRLAGDLAKALARQAERVKKALGDGEAPAALEAAFDFDRENREIASELLPHSYAIAAASADEVLARVNPERENFDPEVMLPWLTKAAEGTAAALNSGTFAKLAVAVAAVAWAAEVAGVFEKVTEKQSGVWAQNVTTTSSSFGSMDAAKASSVSSKTWIHNASKEPRTDHAALSGQTVGIDDVFSNGLRYPGDPAGGADDNANCHCSLQYSFNDD